jgi:hypothetical protein
VFAASDLASYVTGTTIVVDGGQLVSSSARQLVSSSARQLHLRRTEAFGTSDTQRCGRSQSRVIRLNSSEFSMVTR